jgi:eukaryotic-like serine/threonine-protein kinase
MALTSGTKLGPYEIVAALGAGGMGEVYRALDTRLDRDVAIKILPSHLSSNPDSKRRFEREARAISSLNHPHICTLYDVGQQDGTEYLVMEFLEGETLADRLHKGPLPLEQVLKHGVEICEGLGKAHRSGVIHRDLKPGNIMLTKTGAKLMDFGLAKAASAVATSSSSLTTTLSTPAGNQPLTEKGTVVGTFQYMSPEQVEGNDADTRSDIFALGAVLYEMVTGKRAFEGKTTASVLAAVLERQPPPIRSIQPMAPPALGKVVMTCLAKDPDERWQAAYDVKLQLSLILESSDDIATSSAPRLGRRIALGIAAAMLVGASIAGLVAHWTRPTPELRPAIRFTIAFPKDTPMALPHPSPGLAIAPDGSAIAYVAALRSGGQEEASSAAGEWFSTRVTEGAWSGSADATKALYVRRMDQSTPDRVQGGDDAIDPFFSPDSLWLGWFSHGIMKKVLLGGGAPVTICQVDANYIGGTYWASDGFIYFAPGEVKRVSASGGTPEVVARVDTSWDVDYQSPQLLPGGKALLLTRKPVNITKYDDAVIFAYRLDTHESVTLVEGGSAGLYLPSGHLLYARGGSFFAVPFDAGKLKVLGAPVEVLHGGMLSEAAGFAALAVSANGVLAYAAGGPMQLDNDEIIAVSRAGGVRVLSPNPRSFAEPAVAPDGQNFTVTIHAANDDIWLFS